jgi:hypothetical protein
VTAQALLRTSIWGMMFVELLGSALVLSWWSRLGRTGRLAGGWLLAATLFGILGLIGQYAIENAILASFFWFPVSSILAFNALASIHSPGRSRTVLRALSWMMVLSWVVLSLTIETPGDYSRIASPMHAIILAAAAAYTLITRVEASRTELLQDSSFVIAAFWVIYAVPTVFLSVAARLWVYTEHYYQVLYYYTFRNTVVLLSYSALLYGIRLSLGSRLSKVDNIVELRA